MTRRSEFTTSTGESGAGTVLANLVGSGIAVAALGWDATSGSVTWLCLHESAASHASAVLAKAETMIFDGRGCLSFSLFSCTLQQLPLTTMETLTSTFPSTTRGHNRAQLDSIIFYSGPESAKTRKTQYPENDEEWLEISTIFAESTQHESMATTEWLKAAGGLDVTSKGKLLFSMSLYGLAI